MSRVLWTIFIALLLTAGLATAASSPALATEGVFEWQEGTTKLQATADGTQVFGLGMTVECDTVAIQMPVAGSFATEVQAETVTYADSSHETKEVHDRCASPISPLVSFAAKANGCVYRFHAGKTVAEMETEGSFDIVCPGENAISFEFFGPGISCVMHIPSQEQVGPVIYRTITGSPEEMTAEINSTNLHYTGSGPWCNVGAREDGVYSGNLLVRGFDAKLNQKNVTVT